jgi:hypothetical protein
LDDDGIDFERHQFRREIRPSFSHTFRKSRFNNQVLPFDIPMITQSLEQFVQGGITCIHENTEAKGLARLRSHPDRQPRSDRAA